MRQLCLIPALLLLALLGGCPGSVIQPLPPGGGEGDYTGQFTDESGDIVYGLFSLSIDSNGVAEGEGQLNGRDVELSGILDGSTGVFDGFINDKLTQLGGDFEATLAGNTLVGDFSLDQGAGDPDLVGFWDAVLQP
jgi:hypothetical protein